MRQLQADIRRLQGLSSSNQQRMPARVASAGALPDSVAEALAQRKAFEETFSKTLRSLREELMDTSIKRLSSRSQTPQGIRSLLLLSDERIDRIMEEALRVSSPWCTAHAPSSSIAPRHRPRNPKLSPLCASVAQNPSCQIACERQGTDRCTIGARG